MMNSINNTSKIYLDFEQPVLELEKRVQDLKAFSAGSEVKLSKEIATLEEKIEKLRAKIYKNLTPWQKVQVARHPMRPGAKFYIDKLVSNFVEMHGDRLYGDDASIIGGIGQIEGQSVVIIGQQKGRTTKENIKRNFGMPHPEGYRKALRLMKMADNFGKPIVTLINTPGAYPGIGAEERGQAEAIARNIMEMFSLKVPVISVIIGEGGSGGALAMAVGDKILMLEHSVYSVISPEGCASILWKDAAKREEAAKVLKLTAEDLLKFGIIDEIIPEPIGCAHSDSNAVITIVKDYILRALEDLKKLSPEELPSLRRLKFSKMGVYET
jgi:acetyl-CoA carboxylase carboxyl transferase subunit alpha